MKGSPLNRIYRLGLIALAMMIFGVIGYRLTAQLDWLDALYMTVITLSTVGFREVGPGLDDDAKLFTIVLIVGGAGVLAYAVTTTTEVLLDETTRHYFQQRATLRRSRSMKNHFIVCGIGRVGKAVCEELESEGIPFLVVEANQELVGEASSRGWRAIQGDATEERILLQAGIDRARGLMTCIDSDANNLMVIMSARGLNEKIEISGRVAEERNIDKFRRAGASHVYSPFSLLGRRIARALTRPRVTELLDLALEQTNYDLAIEECPVAETSSLVGQTLAECGFRVRFGAVVLSIIRETREILHNPSADTAVLGHDILVVLGKPDQLRAIREALS
ncbi:MAG: potassium channel protein [Candidatus Eremiobacteraeota bacterium]|nr:potassium channel protein [Candidatus Eremiobacteraeota bacterium]